VKKLFLIFNLFLLVTIGCKRIDTNSSNVQVVQNQAIELWTENFGNPKNPTILLIMGAGAQSIMWPTEFCNKLVDKGFFVIRYDARDTGKSSSINYKKTPYNIMDLTKDAIAILDHYQIQKANIVGLSMGGEVAQFIGAYYPTRVSSLTMIATTISLENWFAALDGRKANSNLSGPNAHYIECLKGGSKTDSLEDKIKDFVHNMRLLNGNKLQFDKELYTQLAKENYARSSLHNPFINHLAALKSSIKEQAKIISTIKVPSLIIEGSEDPVHGVDHGYALNQKIKGSKLEIIDGMGHILNTRIYDEVVALIANHAK